MLCAQGLAYLPRTPAYVRHLNSPGRTAEASNPARRCGCRSSPSSPRSPHPPQPDVSRDAARAQRSCSRRASRSRRGPTAADRFALLSRPRPVARRPAPRLPGRGDGHRRPVDRPLSGIPSARGPILALRPRPTTEGADSRAHIDPAVEKAPDLGKARVTPRQADVVDRMARLRASLEAKSRPAPENNNRSKAKTKRSVESGHAGRLTPRLLWTAQG